MVSSLDSLSSNSEDCPLLLNRRIRSFEGFLCTGAASAADLAVNKARYETRQATKMAVGGRLSVSHNY